jgi:hypothetical protein
MGEALMWSLEQQFGASFTPQLREAWSALYAPVQERIAARRRTGCECDGTLRARAMLAPNEGRRALGRAGSGAN